MSNDEELNSRFLSDLQERAKELKCLYDIEELLNKLDLPIDGVFEKLLKYIPQACQYADICQVILTYENKVYKTSEFTPTKWELTADIVVQKEIVGKVSIYYLAECPKSDIGPFLNEEKRLLETIADRMSHFILYHKMRDINVELGKAVATANISGETNWRILLNLLLKSDKDLYQKVSRKMLNYLCSMGVKKAWEILDRTPSYIGPIDKVIGEVNQPIRKKTPNPEVYRTDEIFELAAKNFSAEELLFKVEKWLQEDRANNIIRVIDSRRSSFQDIELSLRRFQHMLDESKTLPEHTRNALCVSLTRRFLTEQLEYIMIAKNIFNISDFNELVGRTIANPDSFGKIGGKGAGLFLAKKILAKAEQNPETKIGKVLIPKTWYLVSDSLFDFVNNNDLEDVFEQKYKDIDQVRHAYSNIVQLFKNSNFPPKLIQGLSMALDDFGEVPIIVRSSSLLEDSLGTSFSGKYKSLFLPNNGTREERLNDLLDAISEIYASVFSPDPIAYRKQNDLLDFSEEMGILIQEVVGKKIGKYYFPAFAGVAFSNNEFRWSPRIAQKDGLVRMVPGLGTRAVDRLDDDYPFLAVPQKPNLRVNTVPSEIINYAPKKIDVIDLEQKVFKTLDIDELLRETNGEFPALSLVFSKYNDGIFSNVNPLMLDVEQDLLVANFENLLSSTDFIRNTANILTILEDNLKTPVDIEFAFDGENFYLLQCRPQSYSPESSPASIPQDIPLEQTIFSATNMCQMAGCLIFHTLFMLTHMLMTCLRQSS